MKASAMTVSLILIIVPLSGCMDSGDGPQIEITSEDLEYLFEENFDDFVNNTTITVNQDVNYYNNTSIQQPYVLKSSSGTMKGLDSAEGSSASPAILVRYDRWNYGEVVPGMNGANLCVGIGTELEGKMQDWFSSLEISFTSVPVADTAEATAKLIDGSCDAMALENLYLAEEKEAQLENNSEDEEEYWTDSRYQASMTGPGVVGNSMSIVISQSSDEMISGVVYLLAQVTLYATCPVESTGCNEIEQTLTPESSSFEMESTCSHNVSFSWAANHHVGGQDPLFRGHGLDCTHSLNLHVSQNVFSNTPANMTGYDSEVHELSWGDWVYSVVWESVPIEE